MSRARSDSVKCFTSGSISSAVSGFGIEPVGYQQHCPSARATQELGTALTFSADTCQVDGLGPPCIDAAVPLSSVTTSWSGGVGARSRLTERECHYFAHRAAPVGIPRSGLANVWGLTCGPTDRRAPSYNRTAGVVDHHASEARSPDTRAGRFNAELGSKVASAADPGYIPSSTSGSQARP